VKPESDPVIKIVRTMWVRLIDLRGRCRNSEAVCKIQSEAQGRCVQHGAVQHRAEASVGPTRSWGMVAAKVGGGRDVGEPRQSKNETAETRNPANDPLYGVGAFTEVEPCTTDSECSVNNSTKNICDRAPTGIAAPLAVAAQQQSLRISDGHFIAIKEDLGQSSLHKSRGTNDRQY
jgi:hypothetical protein